MQDCKSNDTLVLRGKSLRKRMCTKIPQEMNQMEKFPYSNVVRSFIYVEMCTRPSIWYVVGLVSIYQYNLDKPYWKAAKRILRYMKGIAIYY